MSGFEAIQPEGWPRPRGYMNGALSIGEGVRVLLTAGQIGWNADGTFESDDLVEQFGRALDNVIAIVRAAGGETTDIARMTVYVTRLDEYRASLPAFGIAWKTRLGKHFPAMALVGVAGLVEPRAKVEIEATAFITAKQSE
jgi:enamine deaminase RidA (YjgF/YER057c/UK114 family)